MKRIVAVLVVVVIALALLTGFSLATELPRSAQSITSGLSSSASISNSANIGSKSNFSIFPTPIRHVIIIVMENKEYSDVINSSNAPYQTYLASHYAIADQYYAVSHPSLPNYLALIAGSDFGITSDCIPSSCSQNSSNIVSLLNESGLSWKAYEESMPTNCSQNTSPDKLYAPKHDPFVYFSSITGNNGSGEVSQYCESHVVPFTQFSTDLTSNSLPNFAIITPNICDDAHSCSLTVGDRWLSQVVPQITNSSSFGSAALFITYDEGNTSAGFGVVHGGHVLCILISPLSKISFISKEDYNHYSLLATVETVLGLGNLGRNDSSATVMQDLFSSKL